MTLCVFQTLLALVQYMYIFHVHLFAPLSHSIVPLRNKHLFRVILSMYILVTYMSPS